MSFLGFETLGVLGKYQEGAAFAALDRLNDRPSLDEKCAWCVGKGFRKYVVRGKRDTSVEICTHCEGTGLHGELGVAG